MSRGRPRNPPPVHPVDVDALESVSLQDMIYLYGWTIAGLSEALRFKSESHVRRLISKERAGTPSDRVQRSCWFLLKYQESH